MSVDDRDFLDEAVTTELQLFGFNAPTQEAPAFFAVGTAIMDSEGNELSPDDSFVEERTQPIPRMTMAELVFASSEPLARGTAIAAPLPMRRGSSAVGTVAPATRPNAPVTTLEQIASRHSGDAGDQELGQWPLSDQVELRASVPATSRKIRPRRSRPRARTIAARRLTNVELREVADARVERADRPQTRAECAGEQRPCPWVSCKHHLYLDVNPRTGSIKLNFPDLEPWELKQTCALDVADDGGHTLEEVGDITNLTRERIRQLELRGLVELRGRSRSLR